MLHLLSSLFDKSIIPQENMTSKHESIDKTRQNMTNGISYFRYATMNTYNNTQRGINLWKIKQ